MEIELRRRVPGGLDDEAHYRWQADPLQVATTVPARSREAFDEWVGRTDADPATVMRMIYADGQLVGTINTFELADGRYIGYRVDNDHWGRGIATEAIKQMLELDTRRPLFAIVLATNVASAKALQRNGFTVVGASGEGPDRELHLGLS